MEVGHDNDNTANSHDQGSQGVGDGAGERDHPTLFRTGSGGNAVPARRKSISVQSRKSIVMQKPENCAQAVARRMSNTSEVETGIQAWGEKVRANPSRIWSAGSLARMGRSTRESNSSQGHAFPRYLRTQAFQYLDKVHRAKNVMHPWRKDFCDRFVKNVWFERITLTLIMLNCIFLAFEDPTAEDDSTINQVQKYSEYFFTVCFFIEMVMKIIGLGLFSTSTSYLRDPWSVLDGLIVVLGIVAIILQEAMSGTSPGIGGLRTFRLLKPLRAVNHLKEVRLIVTSLLQSLPRLGDVLLLFFVFLMLMSIVAIQMWKGALLKRCEQIHPDARPLSADDEGRVCAPHDHSLGLHGFQCPWGFACVQQGNPAHGKLSFDNLPWAVLTLFTAVTMEGWSDTMYCVMDGSTTWASVYFITVILIGAFFISNLALVMISIAFFEAKEREESKLTQEASTDPSQSCFLIEPCKDADKDPSEGGSKKVEDGKGKIVDGQGGDSTDNMTLDLEGADEVLTEGALEEGDGTLNHRVKGYVRWLVNLRSFELFITASIIANTLSMAIEHHNQPEKMTASLEILNIVFTAIFAVESILKVYCFKFKEEFLADRMNIFDAVISVLGLADIIQKEITGNKTGISVLRALRLARIFKQFKGLWVTTMTILRSLEGVSVLTLLLVMVIFVYGLLGMQLFGGKFCGLDTEEYKYSGADACRDLPRSHFDHLGHATVTVFQIITGEDWNAVMYNGMLSGSDFHCLYFVSLYLIGNIIVLNLFIAVLINNFESDDDEDDESGDLATIVGDRTAQSVEKLFGMCCCCCVRHVARVEPVGEEPVDPLIPQCILDLLDDLDLNTGSPEDLLRLTETTKAAVASPMDEALVLTIITKSGWDPTQKQYNHALTPEQSAAIATDIRKIFGDDESSVRSMPAALERLLAALDEVELQPDGRAALAAAVVQALDEHPEVAIVATRYGWATDGFLVPLNGVTASNMKEALEMQYQQNCLQEHITVSTSAFFTQVAADDAALVAHSNTLHARSLSLKIHQQTFSDKDDEEDDSKALFFLTMSNPLRKYLYLIATHKYFEALIIFLIVVSTVSLAMADPVAAPDELIPRINEYVDLVLTICFAVECGLKILAHGFVMHPTSYLRRDGWNRLDFVIVIFSMIALVFASSSSAQKLEVFRMMRTLRPLRFINKSEGLKMVVLALISSIPPLANIAFVTLLIFVIFAILGVQVFQGAFYACSDASYGDMSYPIPSNSTTVGLVTRESCLAVVDSFGRSVYRWENNIDHFDDLGHALLALFEVATLEGWVELMHLGMDAVGPDKAPSKYHNWPMAVYFIVFIVIVSFFIFNLFIGVLIDQYNSARDMNEEEKWVGLTDSQVQWIAVQDTILMNTPKMNRQDMSEWRRKLFHFVQHPYFGLFITISISVNVAIMGTEHHGQPRQWDLVLEKANITFIGIFALEALVKLVAMGPVGYFRDYWNKFDFALVFMSFVGLFFEYLSTASIAKGVFKPLRLARLIRVVRTAAGIRALLKTLIKSLGSLVNVAGLLSLLFFLYAVLGVDLFGRVARGQCIGPYANFDNFYHAIILLFRMSTGEGWQCVMGDARVTDEPYCSEQLGNCGSPLLAIVYFTSFMLLGMYVLLNVFIAIILSGYECVTMEENALLNEDHVCEFYTEWEKRDPCETRLIPISLVPGHIRSLSAPLGYSSVPCAQTQALFKKSLLLHIGHRCWSYNNQVSYQEVLMALVEFHLFKYGVGVSDVDHWGSLVETYRGRWKALHGDDYDKELQGMRDGKANASLAALQIQRIFRGKRGRQRARDVAFTVGKTPLLGASALSTVGVCRAPSPHALPGSPAPPGEGDSAGNRTDGRRSSQRVSLTLTHPDGGREVVMPGLPGLALPMPDVPAVQFPDMNTRGIVNVASAVAGGMGGSDRGDSPPMSASASLAVPNPDVDVPSACIANPNSSVDTRLSPPPLSSLPISSAEGAGAAVGGGNGGDACGGGGGSGGGGGAVPPPLPLTPHSSSSTTDEDKRVYPQEETSTCPNSPAGSVDPQPCGGSTDGEEEEDEEEEEGQGSREAKAAGKGVRKAEQKQRRSKQ